MRQTAPAMLSPAQPKPSAFLHSLDPERTRRSSGAPSELRPHQFRRLPLVASIQRAMDKPAARSYRGDRTDGKKLIGRDGQVVAVEHHEIGQLAGLEGSKRILPKGQVGVGAGVGDQRLFAGNRRVVDAAASVRAMARPLSSCPGVMRWRSRRIRVAR